MTADPDDLIARMIEAAARGVFESHAFFGADPDKPEWVPRGNSTRQSQARHLARAALAAAVREAGLDAEMIAMIAPACERLGARSEGMPRIEAGWRSTAALLRALAGIADAE